MKNEKYAKDFSPLDPADSALPLSRQYSKLMYAICSRQMSIRFDYYQPAQPPFLFMAGGRSKKTYY
ncbi:MAG: hypothetical protein R3B47_00230 [Bacteroidia bacterium]